MRFNELCSASGCNNVFKIGNKFCHYHDLISHSVLCHVRSCSRDKCKPHARYCNHHQNLAFCLTFRKPFEFTFFYEKLLYIAHRNINYND